MTTTVAVPMMRSSSNGLVVSDAAVASPIAQDHQAIGCRSRGSADPVTARQTPRLRRATTALTAIAIASRPTMLQVTAAGTRAGSSAVGEPASAALLALESLGDSEPRSAGSASSLDGESLGDSSSREGASEPLSEPPLDRESLGDSEARGDSDGSLDDSDGVACGDAEGLGSAEPPELPAPEPLPEPLPEPPPDPGDGLAVGVPPLEPPDPPPLDGVAVGEAAWDEDVGDDVGDGLGVEVVDRVTGGAMAGGTLPLPARSCCHDQPTDPPSGTVSEPTLEDE